MVKEENERLRQEIEVLRRSGGGRPPSTDQGRLQRAATSSTNGGGRMMAVAHESPAAPPAPSGSPFAQFVSSFQRGNQQTGPPPTTSTLARQTSADPYGRGSDRYWASAPRRAERGGALDGSCCADPYDLLHSGSRRAGSVTSFAPAAGPPSSMVRTNARAFVATQLTFAIVARGTVGLTARRQWTSRSRKPVPERWPSTRLCPRTRRSTATPGRPKPSYEFVHGAHTDQLAAGQQRLAAEVQF